ncbi:MAG: hypothetical protein ABIF71_14975 [Planctomycetota bacterium]
MRDILMWVCSMGAVLTGAYVVYKLLTAPKGGEDVRLGSTLPRPGTARMVPRVKTGTGVVSAAKPLDPPPPPGIVTTDGVEGVSTVKPLKRSQETAGDFIQGLDEDVKSAYGERQSLSDGEAPESEILVEHADPDDAELTDESTAADVLNMVGELKAQSPFQADFYGEKAGGFEGQAAGPVVAEESTLAPDEFTEVAADDRSGTDEAVAIGSQLDSVFGGLDDPADAPLKPGPQEVSAAFHRLEDEAVTEQDAPAPLADEAIPPPEEATPAAPADSDAPADDAPQATQKKQEGDGTLFGGSRRV